MMITAPSKSKRIVTSRNTKAVSLPDFQADIKCFADRYSQCPKRDLADSCSDSHGPPRPSGHLLRLPPTLSPMEEDNRQERRWRSTRLIVHREIFVKERATVKRCIRDTRKLHYSSKIDICSTTKQLFSV